VSRGRGRPRHKNLSASEFNGGEAPGPTVSSSPFLIELLFPGGSREGAHLVEGLASFGGIGAVGFGPERLPDDVALADAP